MKLLIEALTKFTCGLLLVGLLIFLLFLLTEL